MPSDRKHPDWVYVNKRPSEDKVYFENLTRCVFQAGLNWVMIAGKWQNFQRAFDGFDIEKVAAYGLDDVERLTNDTGIIRNKQKIQSTIHNAEEFKRIKEEHGDFQKWLDSLDKGNNYDYVVKRLKSRFKRVGPSTAHIFLWSVGETLAYDTSIFTRRPKKLA